MAPLRSGESQEESELLQESCDSETGSQNYKLQVNFSNKNQGEEQDCLSLELSLLESAVSDLWPLFALLSGHFNSCPAWLH